MNFLVKSCVVLLAVLGGVRATQAGHYGHATYADPRFSVSAVTFRLPQEQQVAVQSTYTSFALQPVPQPQFQLFAAPFDPCLPQVQTSQTFQLPARTTQVQEFREVVDPGVQVTTFRAPARAYADTNFTFERRAVFTAGSDVRFRDPGVHYYNRDFRGFDPGVATFSRTVTETQRRGLLRSNSTRSVTEVRADAFSGFRGVGASATFSRQTSVSRQGPFRQTFKQSTFTRQR